jgi:hypothetical protein
MHRPPIEQELLIFLQTAALIALSFRLWWTRLHRVYLYFFGYLIAELLQIAVLTSVPFHSNVYRDAWVATESITICFYVLVVLELYSVALRDLAGIASVSRRYIKVTLAVSILLALLPLYLEKSPANISQHVFIFERAIFSSIVVFLLLIASFLAYYPVPLSRNALVYLFGFVVYFLTKAAALFINNLSYKWTREMSTAEMSVSGVCLVYWVFALKRQGECKTLVVGRHWKPEQEERLLTQLQAINASLLRAARK